MFGNVWLSFHCLQSLRLQSVQLLKTNVLLSSEAAGSDLHAAEYKVPWVSRWVARCLHTVSWAGPEGDWRYRGAHHHSVEQDGPCAGPRNGNAYLAQPSACFLTKL